jgi:hypothetical protein
MANLDRPRSYPTPLHGVTIADHDAIVADVIARSQAHRDRITRRRRRYAFGRGLDRLLDRTAVNLIVVSRFVVLLSAVWLWCGIAAVLEASGHRLRNGWRPSFDERYRHGLSALSSDLSRSHPPPLPDPLAATVDWALGITPSMVVYATVLLVSCALVRRRMLGWPLLLTEVGRIVVAVIGTAAALGYVAHFLRTRGLPLIGAMSAIGVVQTVVVIIVVLVAVRVASTIRD